MLAVLLLVFWAGGCTDSVTAPSSDPEVLEDAGIGDGNAGVEIGLTDADDPGDGPQGVVKLFSVSPISGPTSGGAIAVLKGDGFVDGTRVYFGESEAADVNVEGGDLLTCTVPPNAPGTVDIEVVLPGGASGVLPAAFTYVVSKAEELKLSSLVPESGPETGGFLCLLNGTGFEPGVSVRLGDSVADGVSVVSTKALTFVAPPGEPGVADVSVTYGEESDVLEGAFEYTEVVEKSPLTLSGILPTTGHVDGGILALVTGTGFEPGITIDFGAETASVVDVSSENSLVVEVPPGLEGKVDLAAALGEEAAELPQAFEYLAAEEILPLSLISMQPTSGPTTGQFMCVVVGAGFIPGAQVYLGVEEAVFTNVLSSGVLTFVAPASEAGLVDLVVKQGEEEAVLPETFTYFQGEALDIFSVEPASGQVEGGTVCLVKGNGFSADTAIFFGDAKGEVIDVPSLSSMVAVVPAAEEPGEVDVLVENLAGESALLEAGFLYLEEEPLTLAKVEPSQGPPEGGLLVMLSGTGFKSGLSVRFCQNDSEDVQFLSANAAVAVVPAGSSGLCDVTVTNLDGETAVLSQGFVYTEEEVITEAPIATLVSPKKGPVEGGTWVAVSGENFANGVSVHFAEVEALVVVRLDSSKLLAKTPAAEAGLVDVTVANPDDKTSTLAKAFEYYVLDGPALELTAIVPASGPVTGGSTAVLAGEQFKPGLHVYIGYKPAAGISYVSDQETVLVVPPGEAGPADVIAVNPDGTTAVLDSGFSYFDPSVVGTPPPAIAGVFPPYGSSPGNELVTISGADFQEGAIVFFGGIPVQPLEVQGDAMIKIMTPAHGVGSVDVSVVNPDGQTATMEDGYVYFVAPPFIAGVVPDHGLTAGGNAVTITGSGFEAGLKVLWGDELLQGVSVTPPDEIELVAPAGEAGPISVTVINPDGLSASLPDAYLYEEPQVSPPPVVLAVSPTHGQAAGGYQTIVTGADFQEGAAVLFGLAEADPVKYLSAQALIAYAPVGEPGATVDLTVVNPDGQKNLLAGGFVYDEGVKEALTVESVAPPVGPMDGGTSVAVSGTGFEEGVTQLLFGDAEAAEVVVLSPHVLSAATPAGQAGPADVTVQNDQETYTLEAGYLYIDSGIDGTPPKILSVAPSAGPTDGGTPVQVEGTGIKPGAEVMFGNAPALWTKVLSSILVLVETPPHAEGTVSVTVTNPDGLAGIASSAFTFYEGAGVSPDCSAVVPDSGSALGGEIVAVEGQNFQDGLHMYVCMVPATEIDVADSSQFTARTPAGAVGKCDVVVVNPDGQKGLLEDGFTYNAAQPALLKVVPSVGPTEGGIDVILQGTGFMEGMEVWFGIIPSQSVKVSSPKSATAALPAGDPGKVDVKVVNEGDLSHLLPEGFEYSDDPDVLEIPKIESVEPSSGPVNGGTLVVLNGANFKEGAEVYFGAGKADGAFVMDSSQLMVFTTPGEEGAVDVTVINPDGQSGTLPGGFLYAVPTGPAPQLFGVVPSAGPESGGTILLVTGSNLSADGTLYLGMQPVEDYAYLNAAVVSGMTAPGEPGPVSVNYIGPDGQAASLPDGFTFISAPHVVAIAPAMGPVQGGTEVVISGTAFQPNAIVMFGDEPGNNVVVLNANTIQLTVPPAAGPGAVNVSVFNVDGQSDVVEEGYAYLLAPEILSIAPPSGPAGGGTPVAIWGTSFVEGLEVWFGDALATQVVVAGSELILCITPAYKIGLTAVKVVNPDGQEVVLPEGFEYLKEGGEQPVVESVAPPSGPEAGGTLLTLFGQHLGEPSAVIVGQIPITEFAAVSAEAVVVETPPSKPGTVDVQFIASNGKSAKVEDAFTYLEEAELPVPPEIFGLNPDSGPTTGNTEVTVLGKNFEEGGNVFFGSIEALQVTFVSKNELVAVTPPHIGGTVNVTQQNLNGQKTMLPDAFSFIPSPEILSVDPDSGSPFGGGEITVSGAGFFPGVELGQASSILLCKDYETQEACQIVPDEAIVKITETMIKYLAPAHAPGFVDLGIVNPDGQDTYLGSAYYYNAPPVVSSIDPPFGPALGGTQVTITGSGFMAGVKVYFGVVESDNVSLISEEEMAVLTPKGFDGPVDVIVVNPDTAEYIAEEGFEYIDAPHIVEVTPATGPEAGGTQVSIKGFFFEMEDPGSVVFFGDQEVAPEDTSVVNVGLIVVVTPPGEGAVDVRVLNPDGQEYTVKDAFTYVPPAPPPEIAEVIPNWGTTSGGLVVSVMGSNFVDGAEIYFGAPKDWAVGLGAEVKNLGTMITVKTPAHEAGQVDVRVVNPNQQEGVLEGGFQFIKAQELPPLHFFKVTPNRAPVEGNVLVSITGKGFKAGIKVFVGKAPAWVEVLELHYLGPTFIHALMPPSPTADNGVFDLMLLNPSDPDNPDSLVADDAFAYTSGGVYVPSGLRIPIDGRYDLMSLIADFNGDGLNDVAAITNSGGVGEMFINSKPEAWDFAGWFSKLDNLAGYSTSSSYAVASDVDADGDQDILHTQGAHVILHRNNGDGTFAPYENKGNVQWESQHLTMADLNCDGHEDIFVASYSTSGSRPNRILVNDGKGNYTHYSTDVLPAQYELTRMGAASDVDLDGDMDLILANGSAMQNRLHFNNCANKNTPPDCAEHMKSCASHTYNGHAYAFCHYGASWENAKTACENNGYHLAVIDDADEQAFLQTKAISTYWMGHNDLEEEGKFVWEVGNPEYTFWCGGQPDNSGEEDCTLYRWSGNGCWNDYKCNTGWYFICEAKVESFCDKWQFLDATYGPDGNFPDSGHDSMWITMMDLDENGYEDVIVANWGQQTNVYMNFDGSFETDDKSHWPQEEIPPHTSRMFPVDIDVDGDKDIIAEVKDGSYKWIKVYLNNLSEGGSGGMYPPDKDPIPARRTDTVAIRIADLDGDFLPDVFITNQHHHDQLLMNNGFVGNTNWVDNNRVGIGFFEFNTQYGFPEWFDRSYDVQSGDIDGDGDVDIVKSCYWAKRLTIFVNDGEGNFDDESELRIAEAPYNMMPWLNTLHLADLDGDDDLDIVAAGHRGCSWSYPAEVNRIRIYLNDGDGYYEDITEDNMPYVGDYSHLTIISGDISMDGKRDIWAGAQSNCHSQYGRVMVAINGGDPFQVEEIYFFNKTSTWMPGYPSYMYDAELMDLDADGLLDIYIGVGGQNKLYLNYGEEDGGLKDVTGTYIPSVSDTTYKVHIRDFDNDNDYDFYATNWGQDRLHVQEVDFKFSDITSSHMPVHSMQTHSSVTGDFDDDDFMDVMGVNWQQQNQLYLNSGNGQMVNKSDNLPWDIDYSRSAAAADFDGDGDIDLFIGNEGLDRLYLNTNIVK